MSAPQRRAHTISAFVHTTYSAPRLLEGAAMNHLLRLHGILICAALAACGGSSSSPDAASASPAAQACASVGTAFCHQMYACYSPTDLAGFQLPATEAECVTQENAHCGDAMPSPGYCKGAAQTSAAMATACAAELNGLTCAELMQTPPPNSVCKTQLCT